MPVEIYYAATPEAPELSLEELMDRFSASGLPCGMEQDEDGQWLVFTNSDTSICFGFDTPPVLATLFCAGDKRLEEKINGVLEELGWSAEEREDFDD